MWLCDLHTAHRYPGDSFGFLRFGNTIIPGHIQNMLDSTSLEIISRFKQAVLTKSLPLENANLIGSNRGTKLAYSSSSLDSLKTKVVEYDGKNHLVLTNETIEKSNYRNKRKWKDFYRDDHEQEEDDDEEDDEDDDDEDDDEDDEDDDEDSHPFKRLKLADILSPINHPSEIVSHPAVLRTFKLPIFGKLAQELIDLIEVEQGNLNWLNKLLQVLNGEDWFYLLEGNLGLAKYDHGLDDEKREKEKEKSSNSDVKSEDGVTDPFFGLPEALKKYEARQLQFESNDELSQLKDELINYLQVSIQRQHEYIKNLSTLRNGIVRAERLKKDLLKWGKEMHDKKSS